jgi:hypothetical protein|tara:strand:+ start:380 stop:565 length:186 start_codon:yes stop_codon:yes gene_type:complete
MVRVMSDSLMQKLVDKNQLYLEQIKVLEKDVAMYKLQVSRLRKEIAWEMYKTSQAILGINK